MPISSNQNLSASDLEIEDLARRRRNSIMPGVVEATPTKTPSKVGLAARLYASKVTKSSSTAKAANFEFPSKAAHEKFKAICAKFGVSQAQLIQFLIVEALREVDPAGMEAAEAAGEWKRESVGKRAKAKPVIEAPAEKEKPTSAPSTDSSIKTASQTPSKTLLPTIGGIKFPKIPSLLDIKHSGEDVAWPTGTLRYPTEEEWETIQVLAETPGQDELTETRFIDEVGRYFNEHCLVWQLNTWEAQEGRFTTNGTLVRQWTPKVPDFRVMAYINSPYGGNKETKMRQENLRHLFPHSSSRFDDGPKVAGADYDPNVEEETIK